ncbi:MAG: hypothetical protein MJ231_05140 [bacterium]|nr:hypothetical protein [bacterium]
MTPKYVTVTFKSNDSSFNYCRNIQIPRGAVITGNTVKYEVDNNGHLLKNGQAVNNNTIELTKPQLAAIDTFSKIDGNEDDITPEELCNGGGWDISSTVTNALQKFKSIFKLADEKTGANSGEGPWAHADFVREATEAEMMEVQNSEDNRALEAKLHSHIDINLANCEK